MSNIGTKIIEQGSTAGGIAKVQYLDESGNVLYEVNDGDKIFKMVNGKISGLAGTGTRMVTADASGNLSASVQLQQNISNGTANNTAWVNIGIAPSLGFLYAVSYYNIASGTLKGTALLQSDGITLTQISRMDNTTVGVSFRINAGILQIITSTAGSSIAFSCNILGV